MRYDTPERREQLAAEYVLGTMPVLTRRRFERLLGANADLRRAVADWNARFEPIDRDVAEQEPPARVWRAIERRLDLPPAGVAQGGWFASLAFWRGAAFAAAALAALALLYVAARPTPSPTANVVAILSDDKGEPNWIALGGMRGVEVAPVRSVAIDAAHAFELWAIADGKPRPLGLLDPHRGGRLTVETAMIPAGGVLAVSIEPAGGSPTGLPTGPVPYKGAVLPR